MNPFLVQILSIGMTISQLFSRPVEEFKVHIDPKTETQVAAQILSEGCKVLLNEVQDSRFDAEVLLNAMVADSKLRKNEKGGTGDSTSDFLKKVDFAGLLNAYKLFCKNDKSVAGEIDLSPVIKHYNDAFKNLKDINQLRHYRMPEATPVVDGKGQLFNEIYGAGNRRLFVPISKIPEHVKHAFLSAEDQNFYRHKGIDLKGLIRAFSSIAGGGSGRPQGGSTITQQVVKNIFTDDDLTIERKMREMLLAARLEKILSKDQILEIYLNQIYFGRSSWGVEMAAQSYFGPTSSVSNLTIEQAALLAALPKGPTYYSPDRHPGRARERRQYVLSRMRDDCVAHKKAGCLTPQQVSEFGEKPLKTVEYKSPSRKGGFYFLDSVIKEIKQTAGLDIKSSGRHTIRSTVHPDLQKATENALREGLLHYERVTKRAVWTGPEGSIATDVQKNRMKWEELITRALPKHYDIPWTLATVLDAKKHHVGIEGGDVLPLKGPDSALKLLRNYDLIFVDIETKDKKRTANLKIPASVQGAALVMENKTGRVLSVTGGFSYAGSEYNRALLGYRQPGSTIKPFVYLAALNEGYQPNTLVPDVPPNPPLGRKWRPKNYDRKTRGLVTFRNAIETSLNLPTVQVVARLDQEDPYAGLGLVQSAFRAVGLYKPEMQRREFSEILGSRETRLIDLAAAYATVANSGLRPTPYFVDSVARDGQVVYLNKKNPLQPVGGVDRVAFYQLKKILEGTLARGTAVQLKEWTGLVAGKTGTSNDENDAWFVCFTNDVTVAVWVGYDDKKNRRNLGSGSTGARVALPIAKKILQTVFEVFGAPQPLAGPPDEIKNLVVEKKIDLKTGVLDAGDFAETFRIDDDRTVHDTHAFMLRIEEAEMGIVQNTTSDEDVGMEQEFEVEAKIVEVNQTPSQRERE